MLKNRTNHQSPLPNEHRIPPDWTACQILDYRNKYAPPILKELKEELINIKTKSRLYPK